MPTNTYQRLADLRDACSTALTVPAGRVFVQPGEQAAWDECGTDGSLWVTLALVIPSPRVLISVGCPPYVWDCVVRVSVIRCVAGMDDRGRPPAAAALDANSVVAMGDMEAIRDVIAARLLGDLSWRPLGPEGGYAGGEWTGTIKDVT